MIVHLVLFKLRERNQQNITQAVEKLRGLMGQVPSLRYLEVGENVVESARAYDLALVAQFDDLEGLQSYQLHEAHLPVAAYMRSVSEGVAVVDYVR